MPGLHRRIRLFYLIVFLAVIGVSITAFAATVNIITSTNAGYQGNYVIDNGYFSASAISYNVIEAAQALTAQPMTWAPAGTAYVDNLVAGNWEVLWTITLNAGATISHTYTITVTSTAAAGTVTTLYTFQFTTLGTITAGQTMTIIWDTGATTWTAPAAVQITVA
jgi:hypothetical protein